MRKVSAAKAENGRRNISRKTRIAKWFKQLC
jgi:hypothetical protein